MDQFMMGLLAVPAALAIMLVVLMVMFRAVAVRLGRSAARQPFLRPGKGAVLSAHLEREELQRVCREALATITRRTEVDDSHRLVAVTGLSWQSFGEVVQIAFLPEGRSGEVSSRSAMSWTLVDWGKNAKNVDVICRHIDRRVQAGRSGV